MAVSALWAQAKSMVDNRREREYELKFKARADDLPRFMEAVDAVDQNAADWTLAALSNSYFDTPDHALSARRVSVRLRRTKGKILQTVKTGTRADGGLMDRDEWELPVADYALDFGILPAAAKRALGQVAPKDLVPVIEVETERHKKVIRRNMPLGPELVIEVAVDRAVVRAGDKSEHFCECELELQEGDIGGFFMVAAEIQERCPLPMSAVTKAARGYRLLADEPATARHMPKFELRADESIHDALAEIIGACIGNMVANEDICRVGVDPEGVHQMRVSIRRLRSALKAFAPYLRPANVGWMNEDLRWLGGALGPARDWDVFIGETLASMAGQGIDQAAIRALRSRAENERAGAYDLVRETLDSDRYAKLMFRLTAFVALDGWLAGPPDTHDPLFRKLEEAAPEILQRPYKKLIKAGRNLAEQTLEQRHAVRIRLKKLRYAVDFLARVYPEKRTRPFVQALRKLQDLFGLVNDLAQAERLAQILTRDRDEGKVDDIVHQAVGQVRGWHARALHEVDPDLIENWDRFVEAVPFWGKGKRAPEEEKTRGKGPR
jgi:triphosphatase